MGAWQERGRGSSGPHMTRPEPGQLACVARAGSSRGSAAQHSEQHPHLSQSHSLAAVVTLVTGPRRVTAVCQLMVVWRVEWWRQAG